VNTTKLNDWMQVIGIFAVVASLIFVGLEMQQAQAISMSQTYQSRTAAVVEWNSAFAANPAALSAFRKATDGTENEITTQEHDALSRTLTSMYYLYDNAHYQYQAGFVSSEFWEATRGSLKNQMEVPVVNGILADLSKRAGRPEFRDLVRELSERLETQAND
jgi:hypothetical protein